MPSARKIERSPKRLKTVKNSAAQSKPEIASQMIGQASTSVLVIEDEAVVAMILEDMLVDMGIQVLTCTTLDDALTDIESGSFDAAIVDMHLRGESGMAAVEMLLSQKIPFLVLSGGDQSALHARYPQVLTMAKPFDKADLERAVRCLLDR